MSCVRSNESGGIGFLGDPRRLNGAFDVARTGCKVASLVCNLWHGRELTGEHNMQIC